MDPIQGKVFVKSFRYRLYPTESQRLELAKLFGCCRYVYNRNLTECQLAFDRHKENGTSNPKPKANGFDFVYKLLRWKKEEDTSWLGEVSSSALVQSALHLGHAYQNFFAKKSLYPKFKSRRGPQYATFQSGAYRIKEDKLFLQRLSSPIEVKWSRKLPEGKQRETTVTMTPSGEYYISIMCDFTSTQTHGTGFVGIDAGITDLATISDGTVLTNPRHFVKTQKKLKRAQQSLARKTKGSKNREKARIRVAKIHQTIASQRRDYLHKFTTRIVRENQAVGIERLNIRGMVRNPKLSKHILDASWGEMRRQLSYKAYHSQHCVVVLADPYFPSTQVCSECGCRPDEKLKLNIRIWTCGHCGKQHQRDQNAAKNLEILAELRYKELVKDGFHGATVAVHPFIPWV